MATSFSLWSNQARGMMKYLQMIVQALMAGEVAWTQWTEERVDSSVLDRMCDQPKRTVRNFAADHTRVAGGENGW